MDSSSFWVTIQSINFGVQIVVYSLFTSYLSCSLSATGDLPSWIRLPSDILPCFSFRWFVPDFALLYFLALKNAPEPSCIFSILALSAVPLKNSDFY